MYTSERYLPSYKSPLMAALFVASLAHITLHDHSAPLHLILLHLLFLLFCRSRLCYCSLRRTPVVPFELMVFLVILENGKHFVKLSLSPR